MRSFFAVLAMLWLLGGMSEPASGHPRAVSEHCLCAIAELSDGWCSLHALGYVAGVRIASAALFDILDPGGHDLDRDAMACEKCRSAIASDGLCSRHHIGFREGRAYMTRLSYLLVPAGRGSCPLGCTACAKATGPFWCESCGHGVLGPLLYAEHADFDATVPERARLVRAAALACPLCAAASFAGGRCPECRIDYAKDPADPDGIEE